MKPIFRDINIFELRHYLIIIKHIFYQVLIAMCADIFSFLIMVPIRMSSNKTVLVYSFVI